MKPIPGKISNKEFKKILEDKKGVLAKKVTDGLKTAGLQNLLHSEEVSRQEVMKAIQTLQDQGLMTKFKRPDQLYREAGIAQRDFNETQSAAKLKKNVRLAIKDELEEEAFNLAQGNDPLKYHRRRVLGKSVYQQLSDEQEMRNKKITEQVKKKEKFDNKGSTNSSKPILKDLPDMDIG